MEAVAHRWYSMDKVGINMYHDTTRSSSPIPSSKFNTRRLSQPGLESVPISASLSNTNDINSRKLSQAGLEVGPDPFGNPHAGWPDPSLPVWGIEDQRAEGPKRGLRGLKTLSGVLINGRTFNGHERLVGGCGSGSESGGERSYEKRVAGLSVGVFWGCVLLIVALLAGGIGGGIGAGLAAKRNCPSNLVVSNGTASHTYSTYPFPSSSTTSPTSAPTTTLAILSPSASPAPLSRCNNASDPSFNGSPLTPYDAAGSPISLFNTPQSFTVACNTNFPSGATYGNPNIVDLMKLWTVDLETCVSVCAEWNAGLASRGGGGAGDVNLCRVVSLVQAPGEFCYLKNGTGTNNTSGLLGAGAGGSYTSAVLVGG